MHAFEILFFATGVHTLHVFYNNILSNENIGKGGTSRTAKNQRASDGPSTPPGLGYPVSPVVRFVAAVTLSLVPSY